MLVQLSARNFRNLVPLHLDLVPGAHLFLGDNGAGKTSLLEAVYLLATTRSFRTSQVADCRRHGAAGFELAGEVEGERRWRLAVELQAGERRRTVNGNRTSLAEHLAVLPVLAWTAGDLEVLIGGPAARRRFLDRGVVGVRPAAIAVLSRYRRVLTEKRQLLLRGGGALASWNRVLAEAAAQLIALRVAYVERLRTALREVLERCQLGFPEIELTYLPSPRAGTEGVDAIEAELDKVGRREREQRQPLLGPHRDELQIAWDRHEIRRVASAGERKALGLALLAAQGEVLSRLERAPTYLLDDADTELDPRRLAALWQAFAASGQVLVTSNRPQVWEELAIPFHWKLAAGRLETR